MDLLAKVAIVTILIIVVLGVGFITFKYAAKGPGTVTAAQAGQVVTRDLKLQYPNASIDLINITKSNLTNDSWNVFVSVVFNSTRPCPTVYLLDSDYPATELVLSVANLYTSKCEGLSNAKQDLPFYTYIVTNPEIAIAQSYNISESGAYPGIVDYVNGNGGYNNTVVNATRYQSLNSTIKPFITKQYYNVWLINYTAKYAQYSYIVIMNTSGVILGNYTVPK